MSKAIEKPKSGAAITRHAGAMSSSGMEMTDVQIPVAYIFQGTPKEQKQYPGAKPGDIIDKLTGQKIEATRFVPIHVYKSWAKFTKADGLIYIHTDKADVPQEDLEWKESGEDRSPAATETLNYYLMFDGLPYPVVFRFKKTSLKAGKHLYSLEQLLRAGQGKSAGLYEMSTAERESSDGPYLIPDIKPVGDPSPELLAQAMQFHAAIVGGRTEELCDDDIPI